MKSLRLLLLSCALAVTLQAKIIPTPEMAMSFPLERDHTKWVPQTVDGDQTGIIFEFIPDGQAITAWTELFAQQVAFSPPSLRKYLEVWKAGLTKADPKIEVKEEALSDNSILVTYTSLTFQEMSLRRFIKAKDGIYMLAYHVRPAQMDEARVQLWREIILTAKLVPNPAKNKKS